MKKLLLFLLLFVSTVSLNAQDLIATIDILHISCGDGKITINAEGGTGNYQYSVVLDGQVPVYQGSNTFYISNSGNYLVSVLSGLEEYSEVSLIRETAELDLHHQINNALCYDEQGVLAMEIFGGASPITYTIEGDINLTEEFPSNFIAEVLLPSGSYNVIIKDSNGCEAIYNDLVVEVTDEIISNAVITELFTCGTLGQITFESAIGGTPPYTYGINGVYSSQLVKSNLTAGTYELSVRDNNGCESYLNTIVIEDISNLSSTTIISDISCVGGANGVVEVNVTDGVAPYVFALSDANGNITSSNTSSSNSFIFNDLNAGNYIVTITDANNCSVTDTIVISEPTQLSVRAEVNTRCSADNDATIITEGFGGTPPYEFSIDGGVTWQESTVFSGLSYGEYQINIKDSNGCTECGCAINPFKNGGFEDATPLFDDENFLILDENLVSGWETTALDNKIEIWKAGFLNVPEYEGNYFVELSANENSMLYQEFCTKEGDVIEWQVAHRGRSGTDVANIRIGGTLTTTTLEATMTTSNTAWQLYSGRYTVPAGQNSTIIAFEGVSTATGNLSVGNFLDGINLAIVDSTCSSLLIDVENAPPLSVSTNQLDTNSIEVIAYGGIPPYEYSLDGGVSYQTSELFYDLENGTYQLITRDTAGCYIVSDDIVIEELILFTNDDTVTTPEDTLILIDVLLNDINIPTEGVLTISNPINGTVTINDNGTTNDPSDDVLIYTPNTGFSGEDNFEYTVCHTNGNCKIASVTVDVVGVENLTIEYGFLGNINCYGSSNGFIEALVSGGKSPYKYQLIDSVTNDITQEIVSNELSHTFYGLDVGHFHVKVTDDSLIDVSAQAVTITSPDEITVSNSIINPSCNDASDGSITIDAKGGTGSLIYSLFDKNTGDEIAFQGFNVFTELSAGTYEVFVYDEYGCFTITEVVLEEPQAVTINSITAIPTGNEPSGNIVVGATGGNGNYNFSIDATNFSLSNSFFDLEAGVYNIIVSDSNNCTSAPFEVTVISLDIDNSVSEDTLGVLTVSFQDAISYQWINVDTGIRIPGATNAFFTPNENGRYQVEMTIPGGTTISARGVNIVSTDQIVLSPVIEYTSGSLGLSEFTNNTFNVFPNPSSDYINVPDNLINDNYEVFNVLGSLMLTGKINSTKLSLNELSKGIYFLKVEGYSVVNFIKK